MALDVFGSFCCPRSVFYTCTLLDIFSTNACFCFALRMRGSNELQILLTPAEPFSSVPVVFMKAVHFSEKKREKLRSLLRAICVAVVFRGGRQQHGVVGCATHVPWSTQQSRCPCDARDDVQETVRAAAKALQKHFRRPLRNRRSHMRHSPR